MKTLLPAVLMLGLSAIPAMARDPAFNHAVFEPIDVAEAFLCGQMFSLRAAQRRLGVTNKEPYPEQCQGWLGLARALNTVVEDEGR